LFHPWAEAGLLKGPRSRWTGVPRYPKHRQEGYGWGDSLYYVKEEGTCIAGMAPLDSMSAIEEMLVQYADQQCVSITVIKGKSGPAAGLNSKRYEEQISVFDMGDDVVYSVDVQGVLFDSQQGASDSDYMYMPTQ
jgi:hypothetical protein